MTTNKFINVLKKIGRIVAYVFLGMVIILALINFSGSNFVVLVLAGLGIFIAKPKFNEFSHKKFKKKFPTWSKILTLFVIFFVAISLIDLPESGGDKTNKSETKVNATVEKGVDVTKTTESQKMLVAKTYDSNKIITLFEELEESCNELSKTCNNLTLACNILFEREDFKTAKSQCEEYISTCDKLTLARKEINITKLNEKINKELFGLEDSTSKYIGLLNDVQEGLSNSVKECQEYKKNAAKETEVINDNFAEFISTFWGYTELQREEKWDQIKGKKVKWTFYVVSVDKDIFGTYTVLGSAKKQGMYDIGSDVTIKFPNSEKEKLLQYNKGQLMTIIGVLDYYNDGLFNALQIKPATVVDTEKIKYSSSGKYSQDCQEVEKRCQYDGNACLVLLDLQSRGIC